MREEEQNLSLKSMPEKRCSPLRRRPNPSAQYIEDQYAQTINFLTQPAFLKLTNLTNLPETYQNSTDHEIEMLLQRTAQLQAKVVDLENKIRYKKKRRIRRTNEQIQKKHKCEICNKKYGGSVSLNLHMRNKHPEGWANGQGRDESHKHEKGPQTEEKIEKNEE